MIYVRDRNEPQQRTFRRVPKPDRSKLFCHGKATLLSNSMWDYTKDMTTMSMTVTRKIANSRTSTTPDSTCTNTSTHLLVRNGLLLQRRGAGHQIPNLHLRCLQLVDQEVAHRLGALMTASSKTKSYQLRDDGNRNITGETNGKVIKRHRRNQPIHERCSILTDYVKTYLQPRGEVLFLGAELLEPLSQGHNRHQFSRCIVSEYRTDMRSISKV
jgi:hypothetical protein